MATAFGPTPPSPGVGIRRKGKNLPKLPLSAFSPPNSSTSDKFPLPPSPSTVHPDGVVDASVSALDGDLAMVRWTMEAGDVLGGRIGGVVVVVPSAEVAEQLQGTVPVLRVLVPFTLDFELINTSAPKSMGLTTSFSGLTPHSVANLRWAFQQGCTVDIAITVAFTDSLFESFEDLISKAVADLDNVPSIIISNLLPPADDLSLPIVKLMNHPTYRAFQARIAALSLIPQVFIKFLPPAWESQVPQTPSVMSPNQALTETKERKEWKRRIKMYLGPVMEAFGYERIIFGSAPGGTGKGLCNAGDWYSIARESLAELAVEQPAIDSVFSNTAKRVYGA